jgi:ribosomal protein S18 acetylase RimI-like enzyme
MELNDDLTIRPFGPEDEAAVAGLWTAVFGYGAAHNQPTPDVRRKLALQPELFFVALVGGRLAGTVMGGYDGHRGWIYRLAVAGEDRRRGIGTALMRHVERALADLGCPKVNLQVMGSNREAVGFYTKLGYAVEERVSLGKIL